jgi:hypothetical protein
MFAVSASSIATEKGVERRRSNLMDAYLSPVLLHDALDGAVDHGMSCSPGEADKRLAVAGSAVMLCHPRPQSTPRVMSRHLQEVEHMVGEFIWR